MLWYTGAPFALTVTRMINGEPDWPNLSRAARASVNATRAVASASVARSACPRARA
jgi:hypothetical protein